MPWALASAYPSSELSAGQFAAIVIAVLGGLAAWLILVYLGARPDRRRPQAGAIARDRGSSVAGQPESIAESRPEPDAPGDHGEVAASGHVATR